MKEEWRRLTWIDVFQVEPHPTKPWAAIVVGPERGNSNRIVVTDYQSGKTLFDFKFPERSTLYSRPFFIVDRDVIVLPLIRRFPEEGDSARPLMQVWRIADPPILDQELTENPRPPMIPYSISSNGRLLFNGQPKDDAPNSLWVDVFDMCDQSFLTTLPPYEQPGARGDVHIAIDPRASLISQSGRTVLKFGKQGNQQLGSKKITFRLTSGTLREVGSGRTIWQASPWEKVVDADSNEGFVVAERFHDLWRQWFPKFKLDASAFRSLETGELQLRTLSEGRFDPRNINANRTLVVLADGSVHPFPFRVNWPLLALCQAILALPLVLMWAVLRWRRGRRNRTTGMELPSK